MKKNLKFAIAQMNPTVGDYAGNTRKIISWIRQAEKKGADTIVFPEAALCGYPVWDLANKKQFVAEGLKCLDRIAAATRGKNIAVILGFIDAEKAYGVRRSAKSPHSELKIPNSYNALAWIEKGKVRMVYHKQLLPTYDVFLEDIFFQPGSATRIIPFKGHKVGLTICEDIWDEHYPVKPLRSLKKQKADLVINISASPYYRGVAEARDRQLKGQAKRYGLPMLYVNQVGGQDDLLFDGRSVFSDAQGHIFFRAPAFTEGLFYFDWDPNLTPGFDTRSRLPVSNGVKEVYDALVMGLRDYFRKNGFKKAVIGLSGGIDSALVATLAVDALGADAVKGVTMPGPFSSKGSWKDSEELAKNLGIEFEVRPIRKMYDAFLNRDSGLGTRKKIKRKNPTVAMENLQARLRGLELMFLSNHEGRLVLTTGNKSELAMGYCTLYGDMAGGLAVIGDVYKTDVYRLAWYRNTVPRPIIPPLQRRDGAVQTTILKKKRKVWTVRKVIPEATLTKAPSAELSPGQKDEDSLPPYDILDTVLYLYIEKNLSRDAIFHELTQTVFSGQRHREEPLPQEGRRGDLSRKRLLRPGAGARNDKSLANLVAEVIRKVDHNEYKRRQTPPVLRVSEKAWFGRRMPITNRFKG